MLRRALALCLLGAALAQAQDEPRVVEAPSLPVVDGTPRGVWVVPVWVEIDDSGEVAAVTLDGAFDADVATAAVHYATEARYQPARRDGRAVAGRVRLEVRVARRAPETVVSRPDATVDVEPEPLEPLDGAASVAIGVVDRPDVATSEMRLSLRNLRDVPRYHTEQWLNAIPGALLGSIGGEGRASRVFLRGFDAGEGEELELRVEGVPLDEPSNPVAHGYADTYFVIPELVRELSVQLGSFDPAQGDFALAGTVDHRLGFETRGVRVLGGFGSYRRRRALVGWSSGGERDDFVAFEVQTGRGFGASRAHRLFRGLARIAGGDERLAWDVWAGTHALTFDSAGLVRADAVDAGTLPCGPSHDAQRLCTHDATQGGAAQRHLVAAHARWQQPGQRFEPRLWVQLRQTRVRDDFTFVALDPRGDALDRQSEAVTVGLRADYVAQTVWRGRAQQLELGVLARHDRTDVRTWRLRAWTNDPYATLSDAALTSTQGGAYASGVLRVPRVTMRAGARITAFATSARDRNLPTADDEGERLPSEVVDAFGVAVLPRGTLNVALSEAAASRLDWTTSVGRGARTNDTLQVAGGASRAFVRSIASETGLRSRARLGRALDFDGRLGAFWTRVGDDWRFDPASATTLPIGPTQRYGAFVSAQLAVPSWLEMLASFAWTEAHLAPTGAGPLELSRGPRLPYVPRFVSRLDLAFRRRVRVRRERIRLGVALGGQVVGRTPLGLGEHSQPYVVVDGSARLAWRFAELALLARNVTGTRYRAIESRYVSRLDPDAPLDAPTRHFAAGAPREILLQLTLHFDPNGLVDDEGTSTRGSERPRRAASDTSVDEAESSETPSEVPASDDEV